MYRESPEPDREVELSARQEDRVERERETGDRSSLAVSPGSKWPAKTPVLPAKLPAVAPRRGLARRIMAHRAESPLRACDVSCSGRRATACRPQRVQSCLVRVNVVTTGRTARPGWFLPEDVSLLAI
jgi:hypothetical protein